MRKAKAERKDKGSNILLAHGPLPGFKRSSISRIIALPLPLFIQLSCRPDVLSLLLPWFTDTYLKHTSKRVEKLCAVLPSLIPFVSSVRRLNGKQLDCVVCT